MRLLNFLNEANVANPNHIDIVILDILGNHGITNTHFIKWARTTFRKEIINDPESLVKVTPRVFNDMKAMGGSFISPEQFKQIEKDFANSRDVYIYDFYSDNESELFTQFLHAMDYFNEVQPTRPIRMSVKQASDTADRYYAEKNKKTSTDFNKNEVKVTKKYSDGSYWCEIIGENELNREGALMNHCVSGYFGSIKNGALQIYSYRTKDNKPHITIEYVDREKQIVQCKLNSNQTIKDSKYNDQILDFIKLKKVEYLGFDLKYFMSKNKIFKTKNGLQFADDISFKDFKFKLDSVEYTIPKEKVKILFDKFFEYEDSYLGFKLVGSDKKSKFFSIAVSNEKQMYTMGLKLTDTFYEKLEFFFIIKA